MSERPLRIGLLGVAHVAHASSYARCLAAAPDVELVGLHDDDPDVAARVAGRLGSLHTFESAEELLELPGLDAVVVCGPTDTHVTAVSAAARAQVHVLCEKPLATNLADARRMIDACVDAGVQLHVAFVCRFYPMVQAARTLLAQREIGPVYALVGGNRGRAPLPPAYPAWITDRARAGGGALLDHSVHVIDAMRHVTGSEVRSVWAETGALFRSDLTVEDSALILLEFDDGAVGSIDPSWSMPASNSFHYDFYLRVLGGDGTLDLDDTRQTLQVSSDGAGERTTWLEPFGADIDGRMIDHFLRCIREDTFLAPAASGFDGLRALEVALAAYQAVASGTTVVMPGRR